MDIGCLDRAHDRFWSKVEKTDTCWLWTAAKTRAGYGMFWFGTRSDDKPKYLYVHRLSYEHHKGPIPEGLMLDHLCSTRNCVNPDHLHATDAQGNRDTAKPVEEWNKLQVAVCGHPFNATGPRGRYCSDCDKKRKDEWYTANWERINAARRKGKRRGPRVKR